jgi:hypothetical protein
MKPWDREAMDLLGPAYMKFGGPGMGEFGFIAVQGWMDCRFSETDGKLLVEFSWLGADESDDASGRGWAVIEKTGTMSGRIYIHQGDDSAFIATRGKGKPPALGRHGVADTLRSSFQSSQRHQTDHSRKATQIEQFKWLHVAGLMTTFGKFFHFGIISWSSHLEYACSSAGR